MKITVDTVNNKKYIYKNIPYVLCFWIGCSNGLDWIGQVYLEKINYFLFFLTP